MPRGTRAVKQEVGLDELFHRKGLIVCREALRGGLEMTLKSLKNGERIGWVWVG